MGNTQGAQDSNSFKTAFSSNNWSQIQKAPEIVYEGVFNEHYYNISQPDRQNVISLDCQYAFTDQQKKDLWVASFIQTKFDGLQRGEKPIDVSIVIDTSYSMDSAICQESKISQLTLVKNTLFDLFRESLRDDDRVGICRFDDKGHVLQDMTMKKDLNMESAESLISNLKTTGGTTLSAGMQVGLGQFTNNGQPKQVENREKRILFITDMLDFNAQDLDAFLKNGAEQNIYVSFIGVGINFNNSITDIIAKNVGCNYFSITKNEEMRQIIVEEFQYNFFPCAFEVDLKYEVDKYEIVNVYGSPFKTTQQQDLPDNLKQFRAVTEINSFFPGNLSGSGQTKGGLILLQLRAKEDGIQQEEIKFVVNYKENYLKNSPQLSYEKTFKIENLQADGIQSDFLYSGVGALKGILLQKYVQTLKYYSLDENLKNRGKIDEEFRVLEELIKGYTQFFEEEKKIEDLLGVLENFHKFALKKQESLSAQAQ